MTNTNDPDVGNYPNGAIIDNPGDGSGTPVTRQVYNDIHQFFMGMMFKVGIVANGVFDNVANGYQYLDALTAYIRQVISTDILRGSIRTGTQVEVNTGSIDNVAVSPLKLLKLVPTWIAPTLAAQWANVGTTNPTGYTKSCGKVQLKGLLTYTSLTPATPLSNILIFTLPVGYCPAWPYKIAVYWDFSGGYAENVIGSSFGALTAVIPDSHFHTVEVLANGNVNLMSTLSGVSPITIDLSAVSFFGS